MKRIIEMAEHLRKAPATFLVAMFVLLGFLLFIPKKCAIVLALDVFRAQYRVFIGPMFILILVLCVERMYISVSSAYSQKRYHKEREKQLHKLTPEEKGYLRQYIIDQKNSIYVGLDDGIMSGLREKGITYLAANTGDLLNGFAFNLQPWARDYLQCNQPLLDGFAGKPMTPREKLRSRW